MSNASATPAPAASTLKVGDTITIAAVEGIQREDGSIAEIDITKTILIDEIIVIGESRWAHGPVVATTSVHTAYHMGRNGRAYLGKVGA